ncbi:MAG: hypothetical protein IKU01_01555 [Bacteroidales bacterium]|nr:hypothetical protein [Bacteroidales bacterium]
MQIRLVNENFHKDYGRELLKARGVSDLEEFLNPTSKSLNDPLLFDNIEKGAELLDRIIKEKGKILIVVDSDCDGFTSSAIMHQYIHRIDETIQVDYILHENKQHGLQDHIDKILESDENYRLVILPDSSSNDGSYHDQLKEINLPCLILDHHITDTPLSDNAVIINNQLSTHYPNKDLTGAGVVYQFCRYLDQIHGTDYADEYVDLAALGIIGDMGSMVQLENRYIAKKGLSNINNFFFKSVLDKQSYSTGGKINPITVAFYVVPLINAMIRVGTMEEKERLYMAFVDGTRKIPSNKRGAKGTLEYAAIESTRECTNARAKQNRILDNAMAKLEAKVFKYDLLENKILLIRLEEDDDFPAELNGLCAMRLAAKFKKPTIVARLNDEGYVRGSARGLNQSALDSFKDFLNESEMFEYTAGHDNAFGCSLLDRDLSNFHKWANNELQDIDFGEGVYDVNFVRAAADNDIQDIIFDLGKYEECWGQDTPEPLIYIHDLNITRNDYQIMGKNSDTLKITKFGIAYMKFHAKELIEELEQYDEIKMDLVGRGNINTWMGVETPQIFIDAYQLRDNKYGF